MRPRRDSRRPGARSASPIVARRMVGEVTFAVIGLLFLIADVRTFSSTFQQTFFGQSNTTLAIMATAVFATSFLSPIVGWRLGPKRSVGFSAALLGIATLIATVSRSNVADLALSIVGIAGGMWWLGLLHSSRTADRPSPLAVALPIAFSADLVLRAAFRTVPLVDLNLALAAPLVLVAALVFLAAGVAAMGGVRTWTRPDVRGALALIALPALFLIAETGGTNGAQVALASGLGLGPEPPRATQLGMVFVGLGLAAGSLALSRRYPRGVGAAVACAAGTALLWYVHAPVVSLVGGLVLAAGVFIAAATIPGTPLKSTGSPAIVTGALALGWLVFVGTAFGFYAFWTYLNAILSRSRMTDVTRIHLAVRPSARHQPRGAVGVRIGDVLIVTTHLVYASDSGSIRQEQVRTILREWDGEKVAIVAGDMNAEPGDFEMGLFSEAGYGDLAEPAGATTTMDDPPKRIDYIWGIGVIGSSPHTVMALGASDHRAVVVNVTKQARP